MVEVLSMESNNRVVDRFDQDVAAISDGQDVEFHLDLGFDNGVMDWIESTIAIDWSFFCVKGDGEFLADGLEDEGVKFCIEVWFNCRLKMDDREVV